MNINLLKPCSNGYYIRSRPEVQILSTKRLHKPGDVCPAWTKLSDCKHELEIVKEFAGLMTTIRCKRCNGETSVFHT